MTRPAELLQRLEKLEALFGRAGTAGEKQAAAGAIERLQKQLLDHPVELKISLEDVWAVRLFIAVCRKHGVKPYRYARQRRTTVMVKTSEAFFDQIVYPEFLQLQDELMDYFQETTDHLIRTVMHSDGEDQNITQNPKALPR